MRMIMMPVRVIMMVMDMVIMRCAAKETPYFMGRHIGYHFPAWLEVIAYAFKMMRVHHAEHDLPVNCEGHVDFTALYHSRPMLIANGMTKLEAASDNFFRGPVCNSSQIDDHYRIEIQLENCQTPQFRIKRNYIAINNLRLSFKRYRIFSSALAFGKEA